MLLIHFKIICLRNAFEPGADYTVIHDEQRRHDKEADTAFGNIRFQLSSNRTEYNTIMMYARNTRESEKLPPNSCMQFLRVQYTSLAAVEHSARDRTTTC